MEFIAFIGSISSIIALILVFKDQLSLLMFNRLTWKHLLISVKQVVNSIEVALKTPDVIVCGGRGGAILGSMISWNLSDKLIPISLIDFYYDEGNHHRNTKLESGFLPIKGKKVLLCVGEVNTGDTLKNLIQYIERYQPEAIQTACVFKNKVPCVVRIDYVGKAIKKKMRFPWHYQNFDLNRKETKG